MTLDSQPLTKGEPLRGAMIGTGYFAGIQMDAWRRIPEADIVAACDLDRARVSEFALRHNISCAYSDVDALLNRETLDFVDIVTRPDSHRELVEKAARAGVHVLCQKPLAPNLDDAVAMVDVCKRQRVRFMVNENWRWQPWYREMKQLLERDTIGRVWHASVRMRTGDGRGETPYLRQPYFKEMPRFLLYETGVHFIDTLRYLISEISCVQALTRRINPVIAGEDLALVLLEFESGASGLLDANRYSDPESSTVTFGRMVLEGEKGSVVLEETGVIMVKLNGKAPRRHVYALPQGLWGDCCHATQSHFVNALLTGGPFETDGRGYLRTFAAVEAAYEAAALHKAVSLD